jgi:hypothetical protein
MDDGHRRGVRAERAVLEFIAACRRRRIGSGRASMSNVVPIPHFQRRRSVNAFIASTRELTGHLSVPAPIEVAFELFSPLGERLWVPGWNPEILHPPDVAWEQGQIFRTREERGDAIWVVSALDRAGHRAEYHRVEPNRYVARVRVQCTASADGTTGVTTSYQFVGLSPEGNGEIAAMTAEAYADKMAQTDA